MKIANEEYQKSLAKLKDDLAFKDRVKNKILKSSIKKKGKK